MPRIFEIQSARNDATSDSWACFGSHREQVTQLLLEGVIDADRTLCVLGAGNCNDLALKQLVESFRRIDLLDIDEQAIRRGIARQGVAVDKITVLPGVDVTGVAHLMSEWTPEVPASDEQVDTCLATAVTRQPPSNAEGYFVVASICLLSQLIESVNFTLGERHPRFLDLLTCIRREHLRHLVALTEPGGTVVLITDVVSSRTLPQLATILPAELPALVGQAIAARNFFSGMNPFVIKQLLETDEVLSTQLTDVRLSNPWVWNLGPRLYAVCAFTAKRR